MKTDLSSSIAANAPPPVARTWRTLLSWFGTVELSPALSRSPQVTTDPSHPISEDRNKCSLCGVDLHDTPELILGFRAITPTWFAPGDNQATCPDGKCSFRSLNNTFLSWSWTILDLRAVSTTFGTQVTTHKPVTSTAPLPLGLRLLIPWSEGHAHNHYQS